MTEPPGGTELALDHERQRLMVAEVGAALRSWSVGGHELIDGVAPGEADHDCRGRVLVPWPNRLRDGRYVFDGAEHQTALTEPERGNALHGLATGSRWRAIRSSTRHLTLTLDLAQEPGYPFALRLSVDYELTSSGVEATLTAANVGTTRAPFGAGLHPYFTLGTATIDELVLEVPARTRLPLDERMLPAGAALAVDGTDFDFRRARRIGAQRLDTCFGDLDRSPDGVARVMLASAGDERQLTVWMDEGFRFVQVYTADAVSDPGRRRGGVAIEPMTCAPDAFNSGDGLLVLEPGASFTGRCGLTAAGF
ncbi:MAG TPA: aldose 1-epimerase family protein [Solirubrobacteraceae bacterium]